jgi:hypothetical protein
LWILQRSEWHYYDGITTKTNYHFDISILAPKSLGDRGQRSFWGLNKPPVLRRLWSRYSSPHGNQLFSTFCWKAANLISYIL